MELTYLQCGNVANDFVSKYSMQISLPPKQDNETLTHVVVIESHEVSKET